MDLHARRVLGAVLLVAVAAVLLLSGLDKTVTGRGVAVPGTPVAGGCVTGVIRLYDALAVSQAVGGPVVGAFPAAVPAPCDDGAEGLVIARRFGVPLPSSVDSAEYSSLTGRSCDDAEVAWRRGHGLAPVVDPAAEGPVTWRPASVVGVLLVGPTVEARSAGHGWSACVVVPDPGAGAATAGLSSDRPAQLARCVALAGPAGRVGRSPERCDRPHDLEVLATMLDRRDEVVVTADQLPTPEQVAASCRRQVTLRTGLQDPTAGGALQVWLEPSSSGGLTDCVVSATGGRRLTDTLVGLGARPLPVTG